MAGDLDEASPPLERVYFGPTIGWLNVVGGLVAIGVPAATLTGTETVPGVQGGGNVDIGVQAIANLAITGGSALAGLPGAVTPLSGTELVYIVQSGTDNKTTVEDFRTLNPVTFATLPSVVAGRVAYITDCNTVVWGANAAGGGTNKVMVWYNGTAWTVIGK